MKKKILLLFEVLACILLMYVLSILFLGGWPLTKRLIFSVVVGFILFLFWKFCSTLSRENPDEGLEFDEKKHQ